MNMQEAVPQSKDKKSCRADCLVRSTKSGADGTLADGDD